MPYVPKKIQNEPIDVDYILEDKTRKESCAKAYPDVSEVEVVTGRKCPKGHDMEDVRNVRMDLRGGRHCKQCDLSINRKDRDLKNKRRRELLKERSEHIKAIRSVN